MSVLEVRSKLTPYQVEPPGRYRLWWFVGGRGIGKTHRGASWAVKMAIKFSGIRVGAVARTWGDARDTLAEGVSGIEVFIKTNGLEPLLRGGRWDRAYERSYPMKLHFANGSMIQFASADNPDSLRGQGFSADWRDEAAFWSQKAWDTRQMAVRERLPDQSPARVIATSTPNGQNWVWERYVNKAPIKGVVWIGGADVPPLVPPTSYDNPHLDDDFLEMLQTEYEGTEWGLQEINGLFLAVQGAIFKSLDATRHTRSGRCGVAADDGEWKIYPSDASLAWPTSGRSEHTVAGQDLGSVHPSTLLIGVWQGDTLCITSEVIKPAETEDAWYNAIEETLDEWRPRVIHSESASPMVTNAQRARGLSVVDTHKSPTSVDDSIRIIQQMLRDDTLVIDEVACPVLWKELRSYRWETDAAGQPKVPARPHKDNDDAVDALRYLVAGEATPRIAAVVVTGSSAGGIFDNVMDELF